MSILGLFFVHLRLFKQTLQFLQQINVNNIYMVLGIEPYPSEHPSPPITTRPRLPPN